MRLDGPSGSGLALVLARRDRRTGVLWVEHGREARSRRAGIAAAKGSPAGVALIL